MILTSASSPAASSTAPARRAVAIGIAALLGSLLAGCATLPSTGPTAHEIRRGAEPDRNALGFEIVDLDAPKVAAFAAADAAADGAQPTLASLAAPGRNDVVGAGDVLAIGIYEVGVALFAGGAAAANPLSFDPSAHGEQFPAVVVDREGTISLPYVGRLHVAGRTPTEIQAMIVRGLKGKSQSPQALVTIRQNISTTVFVAGDVRKPGRFDLSLQNERLLDAIALGGGATYSSEDTVVRFNRGTRTVEERLGRIRAGATDDLLLIAGDRIELIKRPRSFILLGASNKVAQVSFETGDVSLAEAVARAGGPADATADPAAIFLFRYGSTPVVGEAGKPVIYRLDMMKPASYFLSQRFQIRDKDVIFIANAASNRPAKLVAIINQLFSPIVAARVAAGN